ncbi:MAG: LCP family protein [Nocardioides sp.]|nr:LCP family protein [Nocardioides sp.]
MRDGFNDRGKDTPGPTTTTDADIPPPDFGTSRVRSSRRRSRRTRFKRWLGTHRALTVLVATALSLLVFVVAWLVYLNSQLGDVERFDVELDRPDRPTRVAGEAVNILLLGVDDADYRDDVGPQLDEVLKGAWQPGAFRSDTMMVLHVDATGDQAQLVSIPRDSWVQVPGHGNNKVNAALSLGGPELAARTVEDTFELHLDHVMLIDFQGLREVSQILDGVDVYVPRTVTDTKSGHTWQQGVHHVRGNEALLYVRQRYGLPGGDFDRIQRQQNFLRAILDKVAARGTLLNPLRVTRLARHLADLVAVDQTLTNGRLRDLVLSGRHLRSHSIRFLTVPHDGSAMVGRASVVKLRLREARGMFSEIAHDRFESWYADHQVDDLPDRTAVD